jgi:hypothetical protein
MCCVKRVRRQDRRHLHQRQRRRTMAGHRDLPDGDVVAVEQRADVLQRRHGRPADRVTGQERDDLPQPAVRDGPGPAVKARRRPGDGKAGSGKPGQEPVQQVTSSARSAAPAAGAGSSRSPRVFPASRPARRGLPSAGPPREESPGRPGTATGQAGGQRPRRMVSHTPSSDDREPSLRSLVRPWPGKIFRPHHAG